MKLPTFENLKALVEEYLGESVDVDIEDLETGIEFTSEKLSDIIPGEVGIYAFDTSKGILARLTFNICDKGIHFIRDPNVLKLIKDGDLDNSAVVEEAHKYHFTFCKTLKEFYQQKKQDRYYGSSRWDGTFPYRFLKDNKAFRKDIENMNQKLYPCKNCLRNIKHPTNNNSVRNFNIKTALKYPETLSRTHQTECSYIPNTYSQNWPIISNNIREKRGWSCEECGKKPKNRKDLHCHHINHLKHDNRYINIRVLCKNCHAKKHSHMAPG